MLSTIQLGLMPLSFGLLFFLTLLYWGQAAFFSYTKYKKFNLFVFYLAFAGITSILVLRWVESGHFPLSNLYESLLFLSWSFLLGQSVLQSQSNPSTSQDAQKSFQKDEYEFTQLLGVVISPLALTSYAFAFLNLPKEMQKATSLVPALQSNWLMMHVTVMILSYGALLCGSILSMAFLLVNFTFSKEACSQDSSGNAKIGLLTESKLSVSGLPGEALPGEALPGEALPGEALPGEALPGEALPGEALPGEALPVSQQARVSKHDEAYLGKTAVEKDMYAINAQNAETLASNSLSSATSSGLEVVPLDKLKAFSSNSTLSAKENLVNLPANSQTTFFVSENDDARISSFCSKLDNLSYRMLGLGFPLLTVGILSGAVWANSAWGSYWSWDPKETWALITWLVFAIYLHARITKGWSGQKPAIIATLGFFVVWFSYLGVNLIGTGLHSYGWFNT